MKKRVKVLAMILCLSLFATMAIASGESSSDSGKKTIVETDDTESAKTENTDDAESGSEKGGSEATIKEQVIIDKKGIKITATEYVSDSFMGDGVKLLVENNTDKTYTVGCEALIVNDYMINDLFVSEIAPGKKVNETMYLSSEGLNAAGIKSVGKIEMYFHAYTTDDMDYLFKNELCEIQTSEYGNMDTTPNDAGKELYNKKGVKIVGKTVDEDSFWGTSILLYIENTSGKNIGVSVEEMSINGFMIDPAFSDTIFNQKKSIDNITIFSSDLEENGITSIDKVELKFHIYNADTYDTIADSDVIKFSAK